MMKNAGNSSPQSPERSFYYCSTDSFNSRRGFLTINDIICAGLQCGNQSSISSLLHQIVRRTAEGALIKMVI